MGPWQIVESLYNGLYSIAYCLHPKRFEKKHASDLTPYPAELIPFEPVDGADTRYGQLYQPIGANPFKEAGLKGFEPPAPFQVAQHFLDIGNFKDFWWPTLLELNDEINPFPWRNEEEQCRLMSDNPPFSPPVMYHVPTPLPPSRIEPPPPPSIMLLAPQIIASVDKLIFIAHNIGASNCQERRLVCIAFQNSILLYPSSLQDGKFLVKFYILHPTNVWYNAINQHYWLQYSVQNDISNGQLDAHLLTPSDSLEDRATCHNLHPICAWVNLTHGDTYIHGPFDFATIRGQKTCNRVGQECWDVLAAKCSMFTNKIPQFDVPTYSIHLDRGVHTVFLWMIAVAEDILQTAPP
jgi:hypothetical protein